MIFRQNIRRINLIAHLSSSLGWFGSVLVFTILAITALNITDNQITSSLLISLKYTTWLVILPLCFASLATGVIQAIGTKWRLLKHYWIIVKLILTIISTLLLILHLAPIDVMANGALVTGSLSKNLTIDLMSIISKAGAAILALLAITTISIYKPWGKRSKQQTEMDKKKKSRGFYILIGLLILITIVIIKHLISNGGIPSH